MGVDDGERPEAATVLRAAGGDPAALRALHDLHRPAVRRVARGFAELDDDEVEDVTQETFVRAFRNLGRLRDPRNFHAWLLTIARNLARTRLTRRRTAREAHEDAALEQSLLGLDEVHLPDPDAGIEEELVRRIVAELPEGPEKETVRLFYLEGELSAREIALRLGVGKSAITMRLERFRAKVRMRILAEVAALRGRESED